MISLEMRAMPRNLWKIANLRTFHFPQFLNSPEEQENVRFSFFLEHFFKKCACGVIHNAHEQLLTPT